MTEVEKKLKELYGFELPEAAKPAGVYTPALVADNLLFVAGQLPSYNGEIKYHGTLGKDISLEDAQDAARYCMLNILALVKEALGGSFDKVEKFVQVQGFVQSTPDFHDHALVINGGSQLLADVMGDKGLPTRLAMGTNSTPANVPCEILAVVQIKK